MTTKSVNQPDFEPADTDQISPAVDIDACGNIIVVWVGPPPAVVPPECPPAAPLGVQVWGRRLFFDQTTGKLAFRGNQFIVNAADPDWVVGPDPALVHPEVAIQQVPEGGLGRRGNFLVGWNATAQSHAVPHLGVRGQFYFGFGEVRGPTFDISLNLDDAQDRTLAESSQHTLAYWSKDRAAAAWTQTAGPISHVYYTLIDSGFLLDTQPDPITCLKGDANNNSVADLLDLARFIDYLLTEHIHCPGFDPIRCAVDTNRDGETNGLDIQCFVNILTGVSGGSCFQSLGACFELSLNVGGGEQASVSSGTDSGGQNAQSSSEAPATADGPEADDPAFEARWNALVEWFNAHQPEAHPEMTEEAWDAWVTDVMMDMLYGDESP